MDESLEDELTEFFNAWLDSNMEVFGEILQEWEDNEYVKEYPDVDTKFRCNDCGKCCKFSDHSVWVYPYDMVKWLQKIDELKWVPLFLSALFPVEDLDDITGYGLPSQKEITSNYRIMMKENKKDPTIPRTLNAILQNLKQINPSFDENSDYCIYYNHHPSQNSGHCTIYEDRPIQCRVYPNDFPQFSKIEIPGITAKEDLNELPMCPQETYTGDPRLGVKITEDELEDIVIEKANYKTTSVIHDWSLEAPDWKEITDADICDILLQLFHNDIIYLSREKREVAGKDDKPKTFVAGKRPQKKKK